MRIINELKYIADWKTKRKIVVFESDDWGSIRMSSKIAFEKLKLKGIDESNNHYNLYDALESNDDIQELYNVLLKHKDISGRSPVFTSVSIVANPNFEKIKEDSFQKYYYETYEDTLKRYPEHDKVLEFVKLGINERLFVPVFHGREHLNVNRWMNALQTGHATTLFAFNEQVTGVYSGCNNEFVPDFQAAFEIDDVSDLAFLENSVKEGLAIFEKTFGFRTTYFVPANGKMNNKLESTLCNEGIKFIYSDKFQNESLGHKKYKKHLRYLGNKNKHGQIYLTRNSVFEPSSFEFSSNTNWVEKCMFDIQKAFSWHTPAVISTHRVNYAGFLYKQNRENGLKNLDLLLYKMLQRWPDIEFMTSEELGELIYTSKYGY